jgi:regulator of PEP synthase PpsR (kinase-PPPase family)
MACCTVELLRRTSRVSCKVVAMNNTNGTIARSYRREMGKESRLACAKMLTVALGSAAQALAKREAARAGEVKAVRADYWATVAAIEAAA